MIICKICNRDFASYKGLSSHIRQYHKLTSETYYSQYISNEHSCKTCGKLTNFSSLSSGYYDFYCNKCAQSNEATLKKARATFRSNEANIENARNRIIRYNKSELGRQNSSKVGKHTGSNNLKIAHNKYDSIDYCNVCKAKTKHILGIGCMTCYNRSESHKQSIIKSVQNKYGEEYINVYQVPEIKEKIVKTSLERYNTTNPGNSRKARQKAAITMRGNDNNSSWEDVLEKYFIDNNIVYKKQYSDERYPFPCDFYLPDSDTFIEINGYWSHGKHFFDENNQDDLKTLAKWKKKAEQGHRQYDNAIQVWSHKDVIKHEHAVKNNLNFIVLWTYQDLLRYVKQEVELKDL